MASILYSVMLNKVWAYVKVPAEEMEWKLCKRMPLI